MKKLFGTDGIRGVDGQFPLDRKTVVRIGHAIAVKMRELADNPRVLIGRDTRESGNWIDEEIGRGLVSGGTFAIHCGVITTPGLAFLTKMERFDAGVMISASHNPYADNGIKIFSGNGMKLSDEMEVEIEKIILSDAAVPKQSENFVKKEIDGAKLIKDYTSFLYGIVKNRNALQHVSIVLDCGNGSASAIAPEIFSKLSQKAIFINYIPDGRNINLNCGSLHPDSLIRTVLSEKADIGIAFDGDADRAICVNRNGKIIDGDHIMYVTALQMKQNKNLKKNTIVGTVMSNMWLEKKLSMSGIRLIRTSVGDKYVLEKMLEYDLNLGGEQSGHVIFLDHATSGDGILTALKFLDSTFGNGTDPTAALAGIEPYPQILINVRVASRPDLQKHPEISVVIKEVEEKLAGNGRVLIRYSGTEPVARVMVEAEREEDVKRYASIIADAIRKQIGA
ncbi:MAG: phosphoglucosamine mutase [Acidobacteriota bacterium]